MENRMTAQQLKNSILQMAVQGKLVSQDPNDEPASVLLERIRKEKEQLIRDGKIKKNKKESYIFRGADNLHYEQIGKEVKCIEDELPFEIPDSWEWTRLNFIGEWKAGATPSKTNIKFYKDGSIPWLLTGDLNNGMITDIPNKITNLALEKTSVKLNPAGTVLIAMYGATIGKLGVLTFPSTTNQACCACEVIQPFYNMYLFYFLMENKMNFIKQGEGGAQPNISREKIIKTFIPIPPLNEQYRIVERIHKIEPLITKYKKAEEQLYELNSNIKQQLKKSILLYAIEGKLVPQDPNDEPASALLERIRKEKQKLIAEGKIKKDKNESIIYRRDNSYYEKLNGIEQCIDDEIPFTIPQKWSWIRLKNISIINMGASPEGESLSSNNENGFEFHQGKIFFGDKYLNRSNVYTCEPIKFAEENSLLLCVRAPVGKLNITRRNVCIGRGLCAIKPYGNIRTDFLYYFLLTYEKYFTQNSTGSTFKAITSNVIFDCLFPLPSLDEQNKIIKTLEKVYSILK